MSDSHRRKPLIRFSIAALLFLMLCLGGYLSGYRVGFTRGARDGANAQLIQIVYPVADIVSSRNSLTAPTSDFDGLIDLIVTTVTPEAWMENGTGEGEIQPFPSNLSLVVSQTQANHEKIATLLEGLRKMQPRVAATTASPSPGNPAIANDAENRN